MINIMNFPPLVFVLSIVALWLAVHIGYYFREKLRRPLEAEEREDFSVVQAAAMTLLGLLIGFTFSMAVSRYDQRKNYEEAEANAIGTEYARADLLPDEDAAKMRELLRHYLNQRVLFYTNHGAEQLREIDTRTSQIQHQMWSVVQANGKLHPTPVAALSISGMNDVLNSQGYTQAAWLNRIPIAAWILLAATAVGCNLLIGYVAHRKSTLLFMVLPLAASLAFFLIADIDSPRGGVIHVRPENLVSLSRSMLPN